MKILVVDDDADLLSLIAFALNQAGYTVVKTQAEAQALTADAGKAIVIAEDLADSNAMNYEIDRADTAWALKDYVRAYSNIGDSKSALRNFYAIGGKDNLQMMMELLGNWYIGRDAHFDTVTVFRDLIKSYAHSTRLAVWQGRIVDATSRKGDKKQTVLEAKKLTEFFADLRARLGRGDLSTDDQKLPGP